MWKVYNERRCFSSGYSIYTSPLYSGARFFCKDMFNLSIVHKDYLRKGISEWYKADVVQHVLQDCNFVYIYTENDTLERVNELFKMYLRSFVQARKKDCVFAECPHCCEIVSLAEQLPTGVNALVQDSGKCNYCSHTYVNTSCNFM